MRLDRYKIHTIDLVVDRLRVSEESHDRLMTSLKESMRQGKGTMAVYDYDTETDALLFAAPDVPHHGRRVRRPCAAHLFVQLAQRGLPPMQRAGRGGGLRPREDHPRSEAFAARRRRRTAWARTATTCFSRCWRCWGAATISRWTIRWRAFPRRDECRAVRRFRAADGRSSEFSNAGGRRLVSWEGWPSISAAPRTRIPNAARSGASSSRLPQMFGLQRIAVQKGGIAVPHRRQEHRRGVGHVRSPSFRDWCARDPRTFDGKGVEDRAGGRQGDPRAPALPDRRGVGLPLAERVRRARFRAASAAHPVRHADRIEAGECALHPRRALDRPASARQPAADPQFRGVARRRQLGDRRRTRRGDDARRRLHRRRGAPRRGARAAISSPPVRSTISCNRTP